MLLTQAEQQQAQGQQQLQHKLGKMPAQLRSARYKVLALFPGPGAAVVHGEDRGGNQVAVRDHRRLAVHLHWAPRILDGICSRA
jgi:hypothetical protein